MQVPRVGAVVTAAGYDVAFAVAREHGRFAVDRIFVQSADSLFAFRLKLSDGYRLLSRIGGRAGVGAAARLPRGSGGDADSLVFPEIGRNTAVTGLVTGAIEFREVRRRYG